MVWFVLLRFWVVVSLRALFVRLQLLGLEIVLGFDVGWLVGLLWLRFRVGVLFFVIVVFLRGCFSDWCCGCWCGVLCLLLCLEVYCLFGV